MLYFLYYIIASFISLNKIHYYRTKNININNINITKINKIYILHNINNFFNINYDNLNFNELLVLFLCYNLNYKNTIIYLFRYLIYLNINHSINDINNFFKIFIDNTENKSQTYGFIADKFNYFNEIIYNKNKNIYDYLYISIFTNEEYLVYKRYPFKIIYNYSYIRFLWIKAIMTLNNT